jgi:hypothetical protein
MIKAIALYLPQFHPIPENDAWWGKGFTEWTNVAKAEPLYKNHWQPRIPADLGFYDLRIPEVRQAQADLARSYGIYGFCYWHYWFAGRRVIERPFLEMVREKKPDYPFCISWANQTWSGTWHGLANKKILIEQTYPGAQDFTNHFYEMLEAFQDERYIEVNGRKLVFIFRPMDMPSPELFTSTWQELAIKEGLKGIHFVGMHMESEWDFRRYGYEAFTETGPLLYKFKKASLTDKIFHRLLKLDLHEIRRRRNDLPNVVSYKNYVNHYPDHATNSHEYPMIYPGWDNTPRSGKDGWLFENSTPELFRELCLKSFKETGNKPLDEKIVLLKSWNEWAEGNYLEPDTVHGHEYLKAFRKALQQYQSPNISERI